MDKGGGKLQETEEQPRPNLERHSSEGDLGVRESVRGWKFQEVLTYHLYSSESSSGHRLFGTAADRLSRPRAVTFKASTVTDLKAYVPKVAF